MPSGFFCEGCGLVFTVGQYGVRGSRYIGRNLLVCKGCGTAYERQDGKAGTRLLVAKNGPKTAKRAPRGPMRGAWDEYVSSDEWKRIRGGLDGVACSFCNERKTLTSTWTAKSCPRCGAEKLMFNGRWIT